MYRCLVALVACLPICACGHGDHGHEHGHDHDGHGHDHDGGHGHADESSGAGGHSHDPQHGGVLVALGDEYAHVELRLDSESGAVQLWLYDSEVAPVRSAATEVELKVTEGPTVVLAAKANALTGETVGDSSTFGGEATELVGRGELEGTLTRVDVLGQTFTDVSVRWVAPE